MTSSANLHILVDESPAALLAHAAADFLHPTHMHSLGRPWPPYVLALRQGGLRDDLFELAAEREVPGWFDPPICVFHELPMWLGASELRPLGDFERAALLGGLMRTEAGAVFQGRDSDFLSAVEQLFGELRAEAVTPDAYAAAVGSLGKREAFERDRDVELVRMYAAYVRELARLGCRDGRDTLADCAAVIASSPVFQAERMGGRREIRILGLADLRGGWRLLLAALANSPALDRIVLYVQTAHDLRLPPDLVASIEQLTDSDVPADSAKAPISRSHGFDLIRATDVDRELEAVTSKVRTLVEAGTTPYRIAIISRDARPYGDLAIRALARAGLMATARRRIAYREIPVVRAVLALLQAGAEGWSRHGLAELGAQPYFASDIDRRVVNFIGYRKRVIGLATWADAFTRLLAEARAAEAARADEAEHAGRSLPSPWVERAAERFQRFAAMAATLDTERPITGWLEWLADWLERDPWRMAERIAQLPADRWDVVRLDLLGWQGLRAIVADWLAAEQRWPGDHGLMNVSDFLHRLRAVLGRDVAVWTETSRGVQVVEAPTALYRAFDHVFLVGMNAGRFPRRAPSSLLMGEPDRDALHAAGLPFSTTADWDTREDALFRGLVAGAAKSLTLSYVSLDDLGADAIPSSFVEALQDIGTATTPDLRPVPLYRTAQTAAHAARVAVIERDRATGRLSPWNGSIEDPDMRAWLAEAFGDSRIWSPTQIEAYAKCPWSYFSNRLLRLELHEDPDSDIDPRARGVVLHGALQRFYQSAREHCGGPVFLTRDDAEWAGALLRESLQQTLQEAQASVWLGHPALRDLKHAELEHQLLAFLDFEMEENRKSFKDATTAGKSVRTAVAEHEVAFEDVRLERGGVTFRFRGIMDRIEVGVDERVSGSWVAAVDYKNTIYSCPGAGQRAAWQDGVVLQVPLYAWALSVLRPDAAVSRVEYRAIKQARRVHSLNLVQVGKDGNIAEGEGSINMENALNAVVRHVRRICRGEFPAAPAPSCNCPPFCHAWDVCRVRGGPTTGRD